MPRVDDWKFGDLLIRVDRSEPGSVRLDWLGHSEIGNPKESA